MTREKVRPESKKEFQLAMKMMGDEGVDVIPSND